MAAAASPPNSVEKPKKGTEGGVCVQIGGVPGSCAFGPYKASGHGTNDCSVLIVVGLLMVEGEACLSEHPRTINAQFL